MIVSLAAYVKLIDPNSKIDSKMSFTKLQKKTGKHTHMCLSRQKYRVIGKILAASVQASL
jgi:hypothetical protein